MIYGNRDLTFAILNKMIVLLLLTGHALRQKVHIIESVHFSQVQQPQTRFCRRRSSPRFLQIPLVNTYPHSRFYTSWPKPQTSFFYKNAIYTRLSFFPLSINIYQSWFKIEIQIFLKGGNTLDSCVILTKKRFRRHSKKKTLRQHFVHSITLLLGSDLDFLWPSQQPLGKTKMQINRVLNRTCKKCVF